jgi:hypothetical protein
MAWQDEMTTILRSLVNDMQSTTYDDDTLTQVLAVAALQVTQQLDFPQNFTVRVSLGEITPDPTDDATRNDSFVNLVTQKAACIIDHGSAIQAAQQAISVRDGTSAVDLTGILKGRLAVLKQGWCAAYEQTKLEYRNGQGVAGAAVMTPFRTVSSPGGPHWGPFVPGRDCLNYW